jgi:hypothetical protein
MATIPAPFTLPDVPLDVLDFALKRKAAEHIRTVLLLARAVFRESPIRLFLETDPEIEEDERIIVEVDVADWTVEQRVNAYGQYADALLKTCPPGEIVGVFCLRLRRAV